MSGPPELSEAQKQQVIRWTRIALGGKTLSLLFPASALAYLMLAKAPDYNIALGIILVGFVGWKIWLAYWVRHARRLEEELMSASCQPSSNRDFN